MRAGLCVCARSCVYAVRVVMYVYGWCLIWFVLMCLCVFVCVFVCVCVCV